MSLMARSSVEVMRRWRWSDGTSFSSISVTAALMAAITSAPLESVASAELMPGLPA